MAKPFVSRAQMERCKRLVAEGSITQAAFDDSLSLTPHHADLPERLHPKKDPKPSADAPAEESTG